VPEPLANNWDASKTNIAASPSLLLTKRISSRQKRSEDHRGRSPAPWASSGRTSRALLREVDLTNPGAWDNNYLSTPHSAGCSNRGRNGIGNRNRRDASCPLLVGSEPFTPVCHGFVQSPSNEARLKDWHAHLSPLPGANPRRWHERRTTSCRNRPTWFAWYKASGEAMLTKCPKPCLAEEQATLVRRMGVHNTFEVDRRSSLPASTRSRREKNWAHAALLRKHHQFGRTVPQPT